MAAPRFQCLNASRQIAKRSPGLRSAFSTTQIHCADGPPSRRTSAVSDLLSIDDSPRSSYSPTSSYPNQSAQPTYTNPIKFEQGGLKRGLPPGNSNSIGGALGMLRDTQRRKMLAQRVRQSSDVEELQKHNLAVDLSKQISRRWRAGDVYAPHDLSAVEMKKWKNRDRPMHDVFDVLDFNPMEHYRNFSVMGEYMSPMGRIEHSSKTGLRPVNQRRIARAIRRSIGIGMMPSVHRHPEMLYKQAARKSSQNSPYKIMPQ